MLPRKNKNRNRDRKSALERFTLWLKSANFKCVLAVGIGTVTLALMFCLAIMPERFDLKVGSIAPQTITASKDVVDEVSTTARRDAAARTVEPTYHLVDSVTDEVMAELEAIFKELQTVQQHGKVMLEQREHSNFEVAELDFAKALLTRINLTDHQMTTLLLASDEAFSDMTQAVTTALRNTLNTTIREGQVNESIQTMLQIIGFRVETNLLQNVATPVLRKCVRPNMVVEEESTELARQKAWDEVEPVVYIQGQNIVMAGERVARNQHEMLRTLGLLDDNSVDVQMYLGAILLVIIAVALMLVILIMMRHSILKDPRKTTLLMLTINVSVGMCIIFMKAVDPYIVPITMAAMLLTGLLGGTAGMAGGVCTAIIVSALSAGSSSNYAIEMIHLLLMGMVNSIVAAWFLRKYPQRLYVLFASVLVAIANVVVFLAIGLMTNSDIATIWGNAVWTVAAAVIAGIISVGLQPLVETMFSLSTQSKLLELTNPNHPLSKRLLLEAAGTYHHSLIVANLGEAAAEAIGANPLLTRAGAYFHDCGKLKRPLYFKENQQGENLHETTDPYVSAAIVTAHTVDGVQLAQKYHLPLEIQKIISEHHGDTPVMFFYHKALQQSDGKPVDIADFRYDGKRPSTKESAIIMLADTIEAAVRSMPDPTPKAIEAFVERLVRGKLEDGQLSDSPLTLRDIDKICEAFVNALNGAFHERIEYPAVNIPNRMIANTATAVVAPPAQEPVKEEQVQEPTKEEAENNETSPAKEREAGLLAAAASESETQAEKEAEAEIGKEQEQLDES